jgi:hypothetical protein
VLKDKRQKSQDKSLFKTKDKSHKIKVNSCLECSQSFTFYFCLFTFYLLLGMLSPRQSHCCKWTNKALIYCISLPYISAARQQKPLFIEKPAPLLRYSREEAGLPVYKSVNFSLLQQDKTIGNVLRAPLSLLPEVLSCPDILCQYHYPLR